jgi:hypothetical protein
VFFAFSLIIEATTEKVLQFIMPLELIYSRNFGFIEQKMYFLNPTESFKQEKLYCLTLFLPFYLKKSVDLLRGAPYMLTLVLHEDALFHCSTSMLPLLANY